MCCTESEDSINGEFNSDNSFQLQPVFFSITRIFSSRSDVQHTVINSVYVQTLPTAQATAALTDFFFAGL